MPKPHHEAGLALLPRKEAQNVAIVLKSSFAMYGTCFLQWIHVSPHIWSCLSNNSCSSVMLSELLKKNEVSSHLIFQTEPYLKANLSCLKLAARTCIPEDWMTSVSFHTRCLVVLVSGHVNTLIRALRGVVFQPEAIAEVFKGFVFFRISGFSEVSLCEACLYNLLRYVKNGRFTIYNLQSSLYANFFGWVWQHLWIAKACASIRKDPECWLQPIHGVSTIYNMIYKYICHDGEIIGYPVIHGHSRCKHLLASMFFQDQMITGFLVQVGEIW